MKKHNLLPSTQNLIFASFLYFCCCSHSFAQESSFMRALQKSEITLTAAEDTFYQQYLGLEHYSSVTIVGIGEVTNHLENQSLVFSLPGTTTTLSVSPRYVESKSATNYSWAGVANESGFFSITNHEGFKSGFIQTDDGAWSIMAIRENISLLLKHAEPGLSVTDCANEGGASTASVANNCLEGYNTCPAVIDVLLFFTDGAMDLATQNSGPLSLSMDGFAKSLELSVNFAFTQSDIPNKRVRFRWVNYNPTYASSTNNSVADLVSNFAADPTASQWMSDFRADLGIFVSHVVFSDGNGFSNIDIADDPGPSHRHAAVTFNEMRAPSWVLAHELAHLLGAQHNWCNNVPCNNTNCACSDRDFCGHGFRFDAGGQERKTIHAIRNAEGAVRILHFSNPDVSFLGNPTGTNGEYPANNARIIRNTGCMVSGYAPSPYFAAGIDGLPLLCGLNGVLVPKTYSAHIIPPAPGFPGTPPYTYQWWWNTTGVFTYQSPDVLLGSGSQVTIDEVLHCNFIYLHLRVQSADLQTLTSTFIIDTKLCSECDNAYKSASLKALPTSAGVAIYPNPTYGNFSMELVSDSETTANASLISPDGRIRRDLGKFTLRKGFNKFDLVLDDLPSGLYIFNLGNHDLQHRSIISLQRD